MCEKYRPLTGPFLVRVLVLAALKSSKVSRYHRPYTIHQSDAIQLEPLLHLRNDVRPKGTHHLKHRQRKQPWKVFSSTIRQCKSFFRPTAGNGSSPPANAVSAIREFHSCSILAPSATQPVTRARAAYSGSLRPGPVNDRHVRPMPPSIYFPFLSLAQLSFMSFSVVILARLSTASFAWPDSPDFLCHCLTPRARTGPLPGAMVGQDGDTGQDTITL